MKKNIFSLAALFVVAAAALTLTSCSKDDDGPEETLFGRIELGVYVNADILKYYDVVAEYNDDNGNTVTSPVSTTPKDITVLGTGETLKDMYFAGFSKDNLKLPVKKTVSVKVSLKEGVEYQGEELTFKYVTRTSYCKHAAGKDASLIGSDSQGNRTVKSKEAFDKTIDSFNKLFSNLEVSL